MQAFSGQHRKKLEGDTHCWSCHRDKPAPELFCNTCVRSFHSSSLCSRVKRLSEEEAMTWRCQDCIDIEAGAERNKTKQIDAMRLKKVLMFQFNKLNDKELIKPFMNIDYPNGKVVNAMDFNTIKQKIDIGSYSCCEELWSDVKWIVHVIKAHCSADPSTIKAVKILSDTIKEEMYRIQMCHDCYINLDDEWFEMPCSRPHLLLWAKQRSYPYWPAKLMRFNSDQNTVDVQFFGSDHLRAVLPVKDCLLYSKQCPNVNFGKLKNAFNDANNEAVRYIDKLIDKYGLFIFAPPNTALRGNFIERHLFDVIPNAWKELGRSKSPPPIPKPVAASATSARRMSLPVQQIKQVASTQPTLGRIMTRRMSAMVDPITANDSAEKPRKSIAYRRQTVHFDRPPSESFTPNAMPQIPRLIVHGEAKKRKMNNVSTFAKRAKMADEVDFNVQHLSNDSVFKVPSDPMKQPLQCTKNTSRNAEKLNDYHTKNIQHDSKVDDDHSLNGISMPSDLHTESEYESVKIPPPEQDETNLDVYDIATPYDQLLQKQVEKQMESYERQISDLKAKLTKCEERLSSEQAAKKKVEQKYADLLNKNLIAKNSKLNSIINKLNLEMSKLIIRSDRAISEVKKRKWCASCLLPFGPFYCSARCGRNARQCSRRWF